MPFAGRHPDREAHLIRQRRHHLFGAATAALL